MNLTTPSLLPLNRETRVWLINRKKEKLKLNLYQPNESYVLTPNFPYFVRITFTLENCCLPTVPNISNDNTETKVYCTLEESRKRIRTESALAESPLQGWPLAGFWESGYGIPSIPELVRLVHCAYTAAKTMGCMLNTCFPSGSLEIGMC